MCHALKEGFGHFSENIFPYRFRLLCGYGTIIILVSSLDKNTKNSVKKYNSLNLAYLNHVNKERKIAQLTSLQSPQYAGKFISLELFLFLVKRWTFLFDILPNIFKTICYDDEIKTI